jgi:hypothetical protein
MSWPALLYSLPSSLGYSGFVSRGEKMEEIEPQRIQKSQRKKTRALNHQGHQAHQVVSFVPFVFFVFQILLFPFLGSTCEALGPLYTRNFRSELKAIIDVHPRYQWGGSESERKGLDCSGYLFLAARRAGLPVRRTTSHRMARGESGWDSVAVARDSIKPCDMVFWTFKERRPDGHVGVIWSACKRNYSQNEDDRRDACPTVTHASSRRGVVIAVLRGYLKRRMSKISRLTIGN